MLSVCSPDWVFCATLVMCCITVHNGECVVDIIHDAVVFMQYFGNTFLACYSCDMADACHFCEPFPSKHLKCILLWQCVLCNMHSDNLDPTGTGVIEGSPKNLLWRP